LTVRRPAPRVPFIVDRPGGGGVSDSREHNVAELLIEMGRGNEIVLPHSDVVAFVRDRRLHGRGNGWIDPHLLASALVGRLKLWTIDPAVAVLARS
jgi:hypothetical protein